MRGLTAKPATVAPDSLASEPVEESGKHSQRPAHGRGVARGVEVVDCQSNPTRTQGPRDPHAVDGADPSTDGGHASRLAPPTEAVRADSPFRRGPLDRLTDVELLTADWVHWYNTSRLMHRLGRIPPLEYEAIYYATDTAQSEAAHQ